MEHIRKCVFCGRINFNTLFLSEDHSSGDKFSLIECQKCGLIITDPHPSNEELVKYYPDSYYGENGYRFHPIFEYAVQIFRRKLANRISNKYPKGGRILEIGSGRGTLLKEMTDKGWESVGTEFSASLSDAVENIYGIKVYPTPNLSDCKFPNQHFNVILCYHVLEHLPDPIRTLKEIKRILHPSGILIVAVPNIGGTIAKFSKEYWFANDVPRHLFHFTQETLTNILEQNGFRISFKSTLSLEQDVFGFSQSIQNIIGLPYNSFYDLIRSPKARFRNFNNSEKYLFNYLQILAIFIFGSCLCVIGFPIVVINSIIRMGGTIEFWANHYDSI